MHFQALDKQNIMFFEEEGTVTQSRSFRSGSDLKTACKPYEHQGRLKAYNLKRFF